MKRTYFCPKCKKFVKEWIVEPLGRGRFFHDISGGGMTVKVCKKCDAAIMEFVED